MPTYRRPHYLREALASAVGQTYKDIQIIVRDNASGDDTPRVVASFRDSRIEFLQALETGTASENSRHCRERVRGKYLVHLCDDDLLGSQYVEVLVGFVESDPSILAAYGATQLIDANGAVLGARVPDGTYTARASDILRAWCAGTLPLATGINYLCPTSFILGLGDRRHFSGGHNSDNAIFMAAGIHGKVLFTDRCLFYYRLHNSNSVHGHSCAVRAQGDLALLTFIDRHVNAATNTGLPKGEWYTDLRARLQRMFAGDYYQHLRRVRPPAASVRSILTDTTIRPLRAYGTRTTMRLLRANARLLALELLKRGPAPLRRLAKRVVRVAAQTFRQ